MRALWLVFLPAILYQCLAIFASLRQATRRKALRHIIQFFVSAEPDPFVRAQARGAVHFVDSVPTP